MRAEPVAVRLPRFAEEVIELVEQIPPGRVLTYGDVAELLGSGGARAVGSVMARYGADLPWWRVLRAGGWPPSGLESRALPHYREERTPMRADGLRVDLHGARWAAPDAPVTDRTSHDGPDRDGPDRDGPNRDGPDRDGWGTR